VVVGLCDCKADENVIRKISRVAPRPRLSGAPYHRDSCAEGRPLIAQPAFGSIQTAAV
jgi:hypothetical protein